MPMAPADEVLEFLKRAHDDFQPLARRLRFDKDHPLPRTVVALYGSILELTSSCILLLEQRLLPGVPVLLRAVLEAYVDLVNLTANPRYGYVIELSYLREWRKLLQEAKIGKNEYLNDISQDPGLNARIAQIQNEEHRLEALGHRRLKIEQKFVRAGMEKEYRSIYGSLCCDSHNNLRSLMNRHIAFEAQEFAMVFYKEYSTEDAAIYIGTNAELLVRATEKVHEFLQSDAQTEVKPYRAELNQLRGDAA